MLQDQSYDDVVLELNPDSPSPPRSPGHPPGATLTVTAPPQTTQQWALGFGRAKPKQDSSSRRWNVGRSDAPLPRGRGNNQKIKAIEEGPFGRGAAIPRFSISSNRRVVGTTDLRLESPQLVRVANQFDGPSDRNLKLPEVDGSLDPAEKSLDSNGGCGGCSDCGGGGGGGEQAPKNEKPFSFRGFREILPLAEMEYWDGTGQSSSPTKSTPLETETALDSTPTASVPAFDTSVLQTLQGLEPLPQDSNAKSVDLNEVYGHEDDDDDHDELISLSSSEGPKGIKKYYHIRKEMLKRDVEKLAMKTSSTITEDRMASRRFLDGVRQSLMAETKSSTTELSSSMADPRAKRPEHRNEEFHSNDASSATADLGATVDAAANENWGAVPKMARAWQRIKTQAKIQSGVEGHLGVGPPIIDVAAFKRFRRRLSQSRWSHDENIQVPSGDEIKNLLIQFDDERLEPGSFGSDNFDDQTRLLQVKRNNNDNDNNFKIETSPPDTKHVKDRNVKRWSHLDHPKVKLHFVNSSAGNSKLYSGQCGEKRVPIPLGYCDDKEMIRNPGHLNPTTISSDSKSLKNVKPLESELDYSNLPNELKFQFSVNMSPETKVKSLSDFTKFVEVQSRSPDACDHNEDSKPQALVNNKKVHKAPLQTNRAHVQSYSSDIEEPIVQICSIPTEDPNLIPSNEPSTKTISIHSEDLPSLSNDPDSPRSQYLPINLQDDKAQTNSDKDILDGEIQEIRDRIDEILGRLAIDKGSPFDAAWLLYDLVVGKIIALGEYDKERVLFKEFSQRLANPADIIIVGEETARISVSFVAKTFSFFFRCFLPRMTEAKSVPKADWTSLFIQGLFALAEKRSRLPAFYALLGKIVKAVLKESEDFFPVSLDSFVGFVLLQLIDAVDVSDRSHAHLLFESVKEDARRLCPRLVEDYIRNLKEKILDEKEDQRMRKSLLDLLLFIN